MRHGWQRVGRTPGNLSGGKWAACAVTLSMPLELIFRSHRLSLGRGSPARAASGSSVVWKICAPHSRPLTPLEAVLTLYSRFPLHFVRQGVECHCIGCGRMTGGAAHTTASPRTLLSPKTRMACNQQQQACCERFASLGTWGEAKNSASHVNVRRQDGNSTSACPHPPETRLGCSVGYWVIFWAQIPHSLFCIPNSPFISRTAKLTDKLVKKM